MQNCLKLFLPKSKYILSELNSKIIFNVFINVTCSAIVMENKFILFCTSIQIPKINFKHAYLKCYTFYNNYFINRHKLLMHILNSNSFEWMLFL